LQEALVDPRTADEVGSNARASCAFDAGPLTRSSGQP
jgi:hypothetical protein